MHSTYRVHARSAKCAGLPHPSKPRAHLDHALDLWDVVHEHVLDAALQSDGRGRAAAARALQSMRAGV